MVEGVGDGIGMILDIQIEGVARFEMILDTVGQMNLTKKHWRKARLLSPGLSVFWLLGSLVRITDGWELVVGIIELSVTVGVGE